MPELPDLRILAEASRPRSADAPFRVARPQPLVMRGTSAELDGLVGQQLDGVERRGKFLMFRFSRDRIVMNLMLTGRLGLAAPGAKAWPQTAFVFTFGGRAGHRPTARPPGHAARHWLPRTTSRSSCATATRRGWARSTSCRRA